MEVRYHRVSGAGGIRRHFEPSRTRHWALVFLCLIIILPASASALTRPAGDIAPLGNPDGVLNAADILILQRLVLGTLTATPEQTLVADVAPLGNPDGVLNAGDIVVLMRAVQGQLNLAPVYVGPDAPVLGATLSPTNDNPYLLTGSAAPGLEIRLYVDGVVQATTISSPSSGLFSFQAILDDGINQISVTAVDTGLEGPASNSMNIQYINNIPRTQSGTMTQDTVWTPGTNADAYVITADLTVPAGITLTLQPGTVLKFDNGAALSVNGTLDVRGDSSTPVTLTSSSLFPSKGDWAGIRLNSSSVSNTISYALIEYAATGIRIDGAAVKVGNTTIRNFGAQWTDHGIAFTNGASGLVDSNSIDNISRRSENGILISNSSPDIRNNTIGNTGNGILVKTVLPGSASPTIRANTISNTGSGIFVDTASPWLDGNTLQNNSRGIYLYGGARALVNNQNIITGNQTGIQFGGDGSVNPDSVVTNNSIYNNILNIVISGYTNAQDNEVELSGNWWGTTSASVISSSIFDHKDIQGIGTPPARVVPFLDGPAGQAVAGNFLNGRIAADTTLAAGAAYTVVGSYVLPLGTTLTVSPGAVLKFTSNALLHAIGQLLIQGQGNNRAIFTSSDDIAGLPPWWGVLIGDTERPVDHGTGSLIQGAKFENAFIAIDVVAETVPVNDNYFLNNRTAIQFSRRSGGVVSGNRIDGTKDASSGGTTGIKFIYGKSVTVSKNTINGLTNGILVIQDGAPLVQENTIRGNTYGIYIQERNPGDLVKPVINAGNTLTANDFGIYSSGISAGTVVANNNNIFGNLTNYYKTTSSITDDATNNWWNTVTESQIAAGIYSQLAGAVDYLPFLSGPVPVAPVLNGGPSLTNNAAYSVTGIAQSGVQVRLYVNSVAQLVVNTASDGTFSAAVSLAEGVNAIYAEAFNATTTSSPSNSIAATLDTVAPTISLTTPGNGSIVNAYPMFAGTLSEVATLSIAGQTVTVAGDRSFNHGPVALSEGSNTVQVVATDPAGNVTTLPVSLTLDTTPPADPNMGLVSFGSLTGGSVSVIGAAGAVEAGAAVTIANARSGEVVTLTAAADGSFSTNIAAVGGDVLSLVVTDALGNQATWGRHTVAGSPPALAITGTDPANGASVIGDQLTVSGTFSGPANTGIVVAGRVASVRGNSFVANNVPLVSGANNIGITATAPDGSTVTTSLSVTSIGTIPFRLTASPDTGIAPLGVTLSVENLTGVPIPLLEVDLDNNGSVDISLTNLDYATVNIGPVAYAAGLHRGMVRITDSAGTLYSLPFAVTVDDLIGADARIRAVYNYMLDRLGSGNVTAALNAISGTSRSHYQSLFDTLGANLASAVAGLGVIKQVVMGGGWAELLLVRGTGSSRTGFKLNFVQGEDGVWRIESM